MVYWQYLGGWSIDSALMESIDSILVNGLLTVP